MTNRSSMIRLSAATAVTVALFAATVASAEPLTVTGHPVDDGALRVRVAYADLNLATVAGEKTLNRRIAFAASDVCAPFDYASVRFDYFATCATAAKSGAAPQVASAVQRAREIATTGSSAIPMAAITVVGATAI